MITYPDERVLVAFDVAFSRFLQQQKIQINGSLQIRETDHFNSVPECFHSQTALTGYLPGYGDNPIIPSPPLVVDEKFQVLKQISFMNSFLR